MLREIDKNLIRIKEDRNIYRQTKREVFLFRDRQAYILCIVEYTLIIFFL